MEVKEETPEILEDAKSSAIRSSDFWAKRKPSLSVELLSFANHFDELINQSEGKFALIGGNGNIEGIFDDESAAFRYSEQHLSGKSGLIHQISRDGIKSSEVYQAGVPKEIWERYKKANSKPTVYTSFPLDKKYIDDNNSTGNFQKPS